MIADSFPLPILKGLVGIKFPLKRALRSGYICKMRMRRLAWVKRCGGKQFFHFEHGIVREAVYSLLDELEKEDLHGIAAAVLKRYYSKRLERHLMSVAYHYEQAGEASNAAEAHFKAGGYFSILTYIARWRFLLCRGSV